MNILVCIGSSCHKRGSYEVLSRIRELVHENALENTVKVNFSFCLGQCHQGGVTIKIDDQLICRVGMENIDDIFKQYVLDVVDVVVK
jgi:NADH:ubiquinone oxidoreductase subunit E